MPPAASPPTDKEVLRTETQANMPPAAPAQPESHPSSVGETVTNTPAASETTATPVNASSEDKAPASKKKVCVHKQQKAEKAREEKEKAEKAEKEAAEKEKEKEKEKEPEKAKDEKKDKKDKKDKKPKRKARKSRKYDSSPESSSSEDSDSSASDDSASSSSSSSDSSSDSSSSDDSDVEVVKAALKLLLAKSTKAKKAKKKAKAKRARKAARGEEPDDAAESKSKRRRDKKAKDKDADADSKDRASVLEYKRVDELWDKEIHDYKITDTVPHSKDDNYSSFIFTVRRVFDYENKYVETLCDIKSALLKDALSQIMGDVKGVSLVEDVPELDPNMLFNFLPDLEEWSKKAAEKAEAVPTDADKEKEKKEKEKADAKPLPPGAPIVLTAEEKKEQIKHIKLLIEYLNKDYESTKNTLYPLLENHMITFDLLWAVLKPGTVMYTTCAGSNEPRAFKLEYASSECSFMRGKWWAIEGKYLEYDGRDGKNKTNASDAEGGFGWGTVNVDIDAFKGARKIGSLACYPLSYRKDKDEMRENLIARGKKFVTLRGMQYKAHNGLAFMKKKRQYAKVHVNGRIMIDSGTFRRLNPNYLLSAVKSRNNDAEENEAANYFHDDSHDGDDDDDDSECSDCCCCGSEDKEEDEEERQRRAMKFVKDDKGKWQVVTLGEEQEKAQRVEMIDIGVDDEHPGKTKEPEFTDDDYLFASPVVLGWAFNEKMWLEFPVNNVTEIQWNEKAFDSLVLPEDQKNIVRALVESHTSKDNGTIDDIIAGKGRGLVAVLHGPPGVGKTLTAEGVAELLRRPLYCVSSGELGTNPAQLEQELNKILEIASSWGAVLLLDEADVFLERRTMADMHRNALVSIFLRLLEYFQGILFLTSNRVESFDDAFQSRIHIALRYDQLGYKAKFKIWKMFLGMVTAQDAKAVFSDAEIDWLSKKELNGRQIKNCVRTAQALARSKGETMGMSFVKVVLNVAEGFENDLKGTGRIGVMNSYI